jgi:hypothetical protein
MEYKCANPYCRKRTFAGPPIFFFRYAGRVRYFCSVECVQYGVIRFTNKNEPHKRQLYAKMSYGLKHQIRPYWMRDRMFAFMPAIYLSMIRKQTEGFISHIV